MSVAPPCPVAHSITNVELVFTWMCGYANWVRTRHGLTVLARAPRGSARHPQPVVRRSVGCGEPERGRRAAAAGRRPRARTAGDEGDAGGERAQPPIRA